MVLERVNVKFETSKETSFNPCEGFGGFGTNTSQCHRMIRSSFNPCEGFGGFGTGKVLIHKPIKPVSIPVRDLVVLELLPVEREIQKSVFQSL